MTTQAARQAALRRHARGAMLGVALGDALGATVEFMTPREIQAQYGRHDTIRGGGWLRLSPGQVTDDTTMSFSLAEALLQTARPGAEDFARAFDAWMKSKPVDIGNTVRRGIMYFRRTGEACVPPSSDAGNGAAMRCAPVAIALLGASREELEAQVLAQAHVTHHNPLSDTACLALVEMVQAGLTHTNPVSAIRDAMACANRLARETPLFRFRGRHMDNPGGYIVETMRAVLQAQDLNDNFESALVDVVNRGGDADTTGAILGMVMGAQHGEAALPVRWLRALDKSAYRRSLELADALIERSPAWRASPGLSTVDRRV